MVAEDKKQMPELDREFSQDAHPMCSDDENNVHNLCNNSSSDSHSVEESAAKTVSTRDGDNNESYESTDIKSAIEMLIYNNYSVLQPESRNIAEHLYEYTGSENKIVFDCETDDDVDPFDYTALFDHLNGNSSADSGDEIYPGCPISLSASLLLQLTFAIRHNMTTAALNDMMQLINLHCRRPNACKMSVRQIHKYFSISDDKFVRHYFCGICFNQNLWRFNWSV